MHIVLHEPEKPDNTGNIGRTCVASASTLHLIEPLGYILNEKNIKHAGLDYWERLKYYRYINFVDFLYKNNLQNNIKIPKEYVDNSSFLNKEPMNDYSASHIYFATTKAHKTYADVKYNENDFIMFGKESAGIPEEILSLNEENCIRIPMAPSERSLNLANSVAIVLYEALRQQDFKGLEEKGELHRLKYC